jgi:hypothetical protein
MVVVVPDGTVSGPGGVAVMVAGVLSTVGSEPPPHAASATRNQDDNQAARRRGGRETSRVATWKAWGA